VAKPALRGPGEGQLHSGARVPQAADTSEHDGRQWRAQLVTRSGWFLFFGLAPLVAYILATVDAAVVPRGALVLLVCVSLASALTRRLDYRLRGLVLVLSLLLAGAELTPHTGPSPGTLLCLGIGVVLSGVVLGRLAGILALSASAACFLVLGLLSRSTTAALWGDELQRPEAWYRMTASYSVFAALLLMMVSSAVHQMERGLVETRSLLAEALGARQARDLAQEALRENEERLRLALEAACMGTWEWDIASGTVKRGSQTAMLLGLPSSSGSYDEFRSALHPNDRPAVEEAISRALCGAGALDVEFRVWAAPQRWLQSQGQVYRDEAGRPLKMRGTIADITARKRVEDELRESELRWRRISEATFEGIAFSRDGIMFDVNDQLAAMLGYPLSDMLGKPVAECVAPEDRERVREAIRTGSTTAYEHRALCKDGSTIVVETRGRGLTIHGQTVRVTAVRDVSERLRLEAELRRRETLAAMGSLVAGVAHEARTPLFSLSATLDALEAGAGTPDQQHELRDLLRSQLRRLSSLMRDLLDYGRPPKLKLGWSSLQEPAQRVARSCGHLAAQSGIQLVLDLPRSLPEIEMDVVRLEQVLENLLANAIQHAPRGSTVRVTGRPADGPPHGLVCAVEDEGPGVPDADLEHMFEPFFSRRKGGTGMGLAIAERLAAAHGGTLTAGNRPQGGAVFTLFLPTAGTASPRGIIV